MFQSIAFSYNFPTHMVYKILLVTVDKGEAWAIEKSLSHSRDVSFKIKVVSDIAKALHLLTEDEFPIVLLDLELKEQSGLMAFETLFLALPYLPIMVLCSGHNESLARKSVQGGAQGFITKGTTLNYLVPQELRTVIDRKYVEETLFIEKERARVTLNSIRDAVLCTDVHGNVSYLNPITEQLTGWTND